MGFKEFPPAILYEQFFEYMPWGLMIKKITKIVDQDILAKGSVLDLMCGPGYLLSLLREKRPDLILKGIDNNKDFIEYAESKYSGVGFICSDVLTFETAEKFDVIICSGGLHHIDFDNQLDFIKKIRSLLAPNGMAIICDPYIEEFENEIQRKLNCAKLGYEYLRETIANNAPGELIAAAIDILYNDVFHFEFKTSTSKMELIMSSVFNEVIVHKTFPDFPSLFGDYCFICKRK